MRMKDGKQTCPRCNGNGCYRCHRRGYLVQCPICANSELELITQNDDVYKCMACSGVFTESGDVILTNTEKPKPKPKPKKI